MGNSKKEEKVDIYEVACFFSLGAFLLIVSFCFYWRSFDKVLSAQTMTISGPLAERPVVKYEKSRKGKQRYMFITFTNYPDQAFDLRYDAYDAADTELLLLKSKPGDTLFFLTDPKKWAYNDLYYSRIDPAQSVPIYALWSHEHQFLTLDQYNAKRKNDNSRIAMLIFILGALAMGRGFYLIYERESQKSVKNG